MFKRVLLLAFLCVCGVGLLADNGSAKNYPGMNVVLQEIENHQDMQKTLEQLIADISQGKQPEKSSSESLLNYTKAALISLEYLDGVWESKGKKLPPNSRYDVRSTSLPCACNGNGMCGACGGDGYVWIADEEGNAKRCKQCQGTGQIDGRDCNGCRGSGWGNAHPNSPGR